MTVVEQQHKAFQSHEWRLQAGYAAHYVCRHCDAQMIADAKAFEMCETVQRLRAVYIQGTT